jgi:membrane-bound inhibitor of C-type lysozyme
MKSYPPFLRAISGTLLALLLVGCNVPERVAPVSFGERIAQAIDAGQVAARGPFTFVCGGDSADRLVAYYYDTTPPAMRAERGGTTVLLFETYSASGAHYVSGTTSFWEHQGEVTLAWGTDIPPTQVICKEPQ